MTPRLLHELICASSGTMAERALIHGEHDLSYREFEELVDRVASGLMGLGLVRGDRVAIYAPKQVEVVAAIFGASRAGCVAVPINPVLKSQQVAHILSDSEARALITTPERFRSLTGVVEHSQCSDLKWIVSLDRPDQDLGTLSLREAVSWRELIAAPRRNAPRLIDSDMATILYTSGSTGHPKGVVLTHRNLVVGAQSVAEYLGNSPADRILSVLPLSFDAGLSQLTTGFASGATVVLLDYLLPRDVVRTCQKHAVTGITGVPPLWMQLAEQQWPNDVAGELRYFANTGGKMPRETLRTLRQTFTNAKPYLMYGLTEAFRSTYLDPAEVDRRPDSMGKAIPNVEVMVVREDGTPCAPNEPGELVHRGPLVSLGYWKDPERTAQRFRPAPGQPSGLPRPEIAVWSGDTVTMDEAGFLYFVGRKDDMIKSSGYRISPTELEEAAYESGLVEEAAAVGVTDKRLGQAIVLVAKPRESARHDKGALHSYLRTNLPAFMVPACIEWRDTLPRNPNGKIDRRALLIELTEAKEAQA